MCPLAPREGIREQPFPHRSCSLSRETVQLPPLRAGPFHYVKLMVTVASRGLPWTTHGSFGPAVNVGCQLSKLPWNCRFVDSYSRADVPQIFHISRKPVLFGK